jgi:hypothetical protein
MSDGKYKVEVFKNNHWNHRTWRENELSAMVIAEVESKSRRMAMRVIHEGRIIYKYTKDGEQEIGNNNCVNQSGRRVSDAGGRSGKGGQGCR